MSHYKQRPLSFDGLKTVSIYDRPGKVKLEHFGSPAAPGTSVGALIDSLPKILAADSLRAVIDRIAEARAKSKPVLWGIGGHVIKCGLAPVLIDLMRRGYVTSFTMNGAASIHDYEIAIAGSTSEDVESVLPDGRFGSAAETGQSMNRAIVEGARDGLGMGEALGRGLDGVGAHASLLAQAYAAKVPVTVHVAVGTDTPHTFPEADGAAIGAATYRDFQLFCSLAAEMNGGGVYLNVGSAVLLPEVFLKAVSVVRNLGHELKNFTTVNFDFLQHYRPSANVVHRPHAGAGGKGYSITGHHEILIPLLAAALVERG
ncbi:MAG: hypothetical protein SFV18_17330 [Bryobacteraceae bacterium]|nr:hypothetical protein [Bryobacteraceae bacterium]